MISATGEGQTSSSSLTSPHPSCRLFSLSEILSATRNFDDDLVIGQGGFGKVYKCQISTEQDVNVVAIKRLGSMSNQGEVEFRAEIDMLSKLRHAHLVSLIGFCNENDEMILVYDYMPNETLDYHLHKGVAPLNWVTRLKIAIGAARGLDYLHTGVGTLHGVIHRDVKTSNILLDENWAAMISDFGLSKIGPTNQLISYIDASVKGTFGYLDPDYFYSRKLTRKSDVYAFGVVLFELLSGRLPVDEQYGDEHCSLVRWAQKCVKERKFDQMVDPNMKGTIFPKCLKQFAQVANHCLHSVPKERPTMTEIVAVLQALLKLQEKSNHLGPPSLSASIVGINWNFPKWIRPNSDQSRSSLARIIGNNMNQHEDSVTRDIKVFTYDELKLATMNFVNDRFQGDGSYGEVYKGWVDRKTYSPSRHNKELPIAVKKLHRYTLFDVEILKSFHHPNLVKFIGYCLEADQQLFLVYEFMHKGNFKDLLQSGVVARLPLVTKVKIVVGIARAVVFLQGPQFNKTSPATASESYLNRNKILFDKDFTTKLSDYDIGLLVKGEYNLAFKNIDGALVLKSNISGYEIVFVEVLTGERVYSPNRIEKIDRLFRQCGKESLREIAQLCYKICNEEDSEASMLRVLQGHEKLIKSRLKSWLSDPHC